jgi:hypothetical protein
LVRAAGDIIPLGVFLRKNIIPLGAFPLEISSLWELFLWKYHPSGSFSSGKEAGLVANSKGPLYISCFRKAL